MTLRTFLGTLLPAIVMAVVAVQATLAWRSDRALRADARARAVESEVLAAARTGAGFLDADLHRRVSLGLDARSEEWRKLHAALGLIAKSNDLSGERCLTYGRPSADHSKLFRAVTLVDPPRVGEAYAIPASHAKAVERLLESKQAVVLPRHVAAGEPLATALAPIVTSEGELAGILRMDFAASRLSADRAPSRLGRLVLSWLLVAILVVAVGLSLASRLLGLPLTRLARHAEGVSQGRTGATVDLAGAPELASMADDLAILEGRLSDMSANARQSSHTVGDLTSKLGDAAHQLALDATTQAKAAQQTSGFVVKVDTSAEAVSQASGRVNDLVLETTAAIEEMMAQVREIDRSAASLMQSTRLTATAIQEMGTSIGQVADNADELSGQVADAGTAVEEMNVSIADVESGGQKLLASAEATGRAVGTSMDSIRAVERSAQQSERLTQVVVADAENGRARVRSTIEGMETIDRTITEAVAVIAHLETSGQRIGEMLDLIEKVAGQTNTLALNAALIASHAGAEGKAFGVVAAKIRELSASTSERTKDIARLIESVKNDVREATTVAQRAAETVRRGTGFASEAGAALEKILSSARQASQLAGGIARSTVDQLQAGVQMAEAMERVRALIGEIARATDAEGKVAVRLVHTMDSVREKATLFKRATVELRTGSVQILTAIDNVATQVGEISRATGEQAKGGKSITRAVTDMETAAVALSHAALEQSRDSKQAVTAVVEIGEIVTRNGNRVQEIDRAVSVLLSESRRLMQDAKASLSE